MCLFEKIKDSIESIPSELCRTMEQSEEYIFNSSKTSMSLNVHSNLLTPDKIPEFCLPPRLSRRNVLQEAETPSSHLLRKNQVQSAFFNTMQVMPKDAKVRNSNVSMVCKDMKRPPFSAESFGLAGIYESPNTRRKESLFHPKFPAYTLYKKILLDSSPLGSPYSSRSSVYITSSRGCLKGATSCPVLPGSQEETGVMRREVVSLHTFPNNPPSSFGSLLTLATPVLFPLDVLQCQERLLREHVIPLQGRGSISAVGLQLQKSATIRTSHSPVFNEDFYFTALSWEDLLELQLRVKLVDKPVSGPLRRRTVIGVFTKPLSQLLYLQKLI
uniref:C2 domain-containing protein n=1 Tax=Cynoglossus semilaevis TaxID=244447 RepID=A0A3P8VKQ7_CYNSE